MKRLLFLTIIISSLFLFLFALPNKNQVLAAACASPNYCNFTCGGYGSTTDTCANGNTCCKGTPNCASPNYCNFTCGSYGSTNDYCSGGNTCCKGTPNCASPNYCNFTCGSYGSTNDYCSSGICCKTAATGVSCNSCPVPVRINDYDLVDPAAILNSTTSCNNLQYPMIKDNGLATVTAPCCAYPWGGGQITIVTNKKQITCSPGQTCDATRGCVGGAPTCAKADSSCRMNSDCAPASDPLCSSYKCTDANNHYLPDDNQWPTAQKCRTGGTATSCPQTGQSCTVCCYKSTDQCDATTKKCTPDCSDSLNEVSCSDSTPCCNENETCNNSTRKCGPTLPATCAQGNATDCNTQGVYEINRCPGGICNTALGPIPVDIVGFVKAIFSVLLSIVGGIAVLLIIISGYKLATSRGNPEQVKGAQEQLTAAIVGLLFVIFSLVFLEVIGINIIGLSPSVFQ